MGCKVDNYIKRTSRIFLTHLNKGKKYQLYQALLLYSNVVRYFIEMLWSRQDFSDRLVYDDIKKGVNRFNITARLSSLAYKQAKEIVNSQRKKSKRQKMSKGLRNIVANFDYKP